MRGRWGKKSGFWKMSKMKTNVVHQGDCLEVMADFPDNSIDTVITDPPYGLKFMSKNWDHGIPGVAFWEEILRVAKPGATLMAFGGNRTHHRLMVAIEDAGWEIRDCMMWLYAQGFPKSHDVSKGIDKAQGVEREIVEIRKQQGRGGGSSRYSKYNLNVSNNKTIDNRNTSYAENYINKESFDVTAPATDLAKQFDGFGTALKPAFEIIVVAQAPIEKNYAYNAEKWGVAGLNIDGARVGTGDNLNGGAYSGNTPKLIKQIYGEYNKLTPDDYVEPKGRFPANLILSHSPGCVLRGVKKVRSGGGKNPHEKAARIFAEDGNRPYFNYADPDGYETTEDWDCEPDCAIRLLNEQSGELKSGARNGQKRKRISFGENGTFAQTDGDTGYYRNSSQGGASRFFKNFPPARFIYSGKAGKKERGEGNFHPTVKSLKVLEYLCTLTRTPTGGIVLDPFGGSGTTALAAIATDRPYILIEKEAEYVEIAKQRIAGYTAETIYPSEAEEEAGQLTLW